MQSLKKPLLKGLVKTCKSSSCFLHGFCKTVFVHVTMAALERLTMRTIEILESNTETSKKGDLDIEENTPTNKKAEQPRFFCSNCNHEIFLCMAYCDECGGEIAWPKKYKAIVSEKKGEEQKSE